MGLFRASRPHHPANHYAKPESTPERDEGTEPQ